MKSKVMCLTPTTLAQYGVDGNGDGRVDIINSIGDAMMSAGNYLNKLGWNKNEPIIYRVTLPADFEVCFQFFVGF